MPTLHTVIFNMNSGSNVEFSYLELYLLRMPSLQRLEIKAVDVLSYGNAWERLIKTSLPILSHFNLENHSISLKETGICNLMESFQTPFWIENKNFNIVITACEHFSPPYWFSKEKLPYRTQYGSSERVIRCWTRPRRELNNNLTARNKILSLAVSEESIFLLKNQYFDNVTRLLLCGLA